MPKISSRILTTTSFLFIVSMLVVVGGCSGSAGSNENLTAYASIPPHAYLASAIGGDRIDVAVLVDSSQDPHTFSPTPSQMTKLSRARLYFMAGMPFEHSMKQKLTSIADSVVIVDLLDVVPGTHASTEDSHAHHDHSGHGHGDHQHGHHQEIHSDHADQTSHGHSHGGRDPHAWLDPRLATLQAKAIRDALINADPEGSSVYKENYTALAAQLDTLHQMIADTLAPLKGSLFLVFHPAFSYFSDAYGLEMVAIEYEGKEPSAKHMARVISLSTDKKTRGVFHQPQYAGKAVNTVANQLEASTVMLDPLATDYSANLLQMAVRIRETLMSGEESGE